MSEKADRFLAGLQLPTNHALESAFTPSSKAAPSSLPSPCVCSPKKLLAWLDGLQVAIASAVLGLSVTCKVSSACCIALSLLAPVLFWSILPSYRRHTSNWLNQLWNSWQQYRIHGGQLPWHATFFLVVLPAALFMLLRDSNIVGGDTAPVMATAAQLVTKGNCDLAECASAYAARDFFVASGQFPYCFQVTRTGVQSSYPAGMVPFALPVAAVARALGADLHNIGVQARLEKWTASWIAAACLGLFFLLALHLAPAKPAFLATLILATGSTMYTTIGQALWQHDGVIFWSLLILLVEFREGHSSTWRGCVLQGAACAMMLACRLSAVTFLLPLGCWLLARSPRRALAVAGVGILAFIPWAVFYRTTYGSFFGPSIGQTAHANWSFDWLAGWNAVLVSPARGLLVYQPWLLLLGLAWLPQVRRHVTAMSGFSCPAGWTTFAMVVVVLHLFLVSAWRCWWGGHCWGSRLVSEVIPLAGLLCVRPIAALMTMTNGRRLVLVLAVLSCLVHVPAIYLRQDRWDACLDGKQDLERLWCWTDPPFLFAVHHRP